MKLGHCVYPLLTDFNGNIGFYFKDLADGEVLEINSNEVFSAASVIKIPLALLMAELVESGKYSYKQKVVIKNINRVGGTGVIQSLNKDYIPTVQELVELAISVSDNIATNELIDLVGGPEMVNQYCLEHGLLRTKLQRKMLDFEAKKLCKDNWITAGEISTLLEMICTNFFSNNKELRAKVKPIFQAMIRQQCRNKIPALIPAADYYGIGDELLPPAGEVLVANKTGDLWQTQNDVAICILPDGRKYILTICTGELTHGVEGIEIIAKLSKSVYRYMLQKKY